MRPEYLHSQTVENAARRGKQRVVGRLHGVQTLAMRQMRTALCYLVRDCRTALLHRDHFDRVAATDRRYSPTDRIVEMLADAHRAGAQYADAVAFSDQLRAIVDAQWTPTPITSIPDLLRAETQAQAVGDLAAHDVLAAPHDASALRRCAETLRHHARKAWDAAIGLDARAARSTSEWAS